MSVLQAIGVGYIGWQNPWNPTCNLVIVPNKEKSALLTPVMLSDDLVQFDFAPIGKLRLVRSLIPRMVYQSNGRIKLELTDGCPVGAWPVKKEYGKPTILFQEEVCIWKRIPVDDDSFRLEAVRTPGFFVCVTENSLMLGSEGSIFRLQKSDMPAAN